MDRKTRLHTRAHRLKPALVSALRARRLERESDQSDESGDDSTSFDADHDWQQQHRESEVTEMIHTKVGLESIDRAASRPIPEFAPVTTKVFPVSNGIDDSDHRSLVNRPVRRMFPISRAPKKSDSMISHQPSGPGLPITGSVAPGSLREPNPISV